MAVSVSPAPTAPRIEATKLLRDLQNHSLMLALAGLVPIGLALIGIGIRYGILWQALVLFLLLYAVGALRAVHRLLAAWVLVAGCVALDLWIARSAGLAPVLCLLVLPVGCAALLISLRGGIAAATGCTVLLAWAPQGLLPEDGILRASAAVGIWGTVGLMWLVLRLLLITFQWSW
jgi:hypothetical protein